MKSSDELAIPTFCFAPPPPLLMSSNAELFPTIGSVADQTEKLPVVAQTVEVTLDEERPVQEIESLCMRCHEQVRRCSVRLELDTVS